VTGGDVMGMAQLKLSDPTMPQPSITIIAMGQRGVSVTPQVASFGTILPGRPAAYRYCTLGVYSRSSKFKLLSVETDDTALKAEFTGQPTALNWYDVRIFYKGGWAKGHHEGFITIKTDLPIAPVLKVPYRADVP
jgi:hypothetical protein